MLFDCCPTDSLCSCHQMPVNINDSKRACTAASQIPHPREVHQEELLGGPGREKAVPQGFPSPPWKETRHSVGNSMVLAPSGMFRPRARGGRDRRPGPREHMSQSPVSPVPPPRRMGYPSRGNRGLVCRFLSFLKEIKGKTSMEASMSLFAACLHYAVLPNAIFCCRPKMNVSSKTLLFHPSPHPTVGGGGDTHQWGGGGGDQWKL